MVCSIQIGKVGSKMATPMLAKQREPAERQVERETGRQTGDKMTVSLATPLFRPGNRMWSHLH